MKDSISPRLLLRFGFVFLIMSGCAAPGVPGREDMPGLMVERLGWMDEVAKVKQARSLPVTDAKREAELLDAMVRRGTEAGLPAKAVRGFFGGQIEAAKLVQREWLDTHSGGSPTSALLPDLLITVRPALDDLGNRMLVELGRVRRDREAEGVIGDARMELKEAGYSEAVIAAAIQGLECGLKSE
jgi:chorismate mutase-like protein